MGPITTEDLRNMYRRYIRALLSVGALDEGDRMCLSIGSQTYGRAFRTHRIEAGSTGHGRPPIGPDYLGWTKKEAFDTLAAIASATEDTHRIMSGDRGEYIEDVSQWVA
jgi:hypothetical protein